MYRIWGTVAGTVTRLHAGKPRNLGSIPGEDKRLFSPPQYPVLLWGPPSLYSTDIRGPFFSFKAVRTF
jgi:hypothetical protein